MNKEQQAVHDMYHALDHVQQFHREHFSKETDVIVEKAIQQAYDNVSHAVLFPHLVPLR